MERIKVNIFKFSLKYIWIACKNFKNHNISLNIKIAKSHFVMFYISKDAACKALLDGTTFDIGCFVKIFRKFKKTKK